MDRIMLSVSFEDPFWIALVEKDVDGAHFVGKHVFGAEPTNPEILDYVLHRLSFLPLVRAGEAEKDHKHMKAQREPTKTKKSLDVYKNALAAQKHASKTQAKIDRRLRRDEEYKARIEKKKKKRRGH